MKATWFASIALMILVLSGCQDTEDVVLDSPDQPEMDGSDIKTCEQLGGECMLGECGGINWDAGQETTGCKEYESCCMCCKQIIPECVPDKCCHADKCVLEQWGPDCEGVRCTGEIVPNTMDGGCGECEFVGSPGADPEDSCTVKWFYSAGCEPEFEE